MNNSSESKPGSPLKRAALIGGGALALGAAGGGTAALLRKKKLRIGTPLSKVTVAKHMPTKLKQAVGRELSVHERLDALLKNFEAVSTAEEAAAPLFLRTFGEGRDRDGEGRYSAGNIPSSDDYAIAAAARKKKVAVGIGAGGALAGAAVLGKGLLRVRPGRIA